MFELENCAAFIATNAAKILAEGFENKLKEIGITRVQWSVLYYLGKTNCSNQKDLVAFLKTKPSSTTRLLDRMERDGWIKRQLNPEDRREMILMLTTKGQEIRSRCLPVGKAFSEQITKNINEEDLETFYRVFDQLIENVK